MMLRTIDGIPIAYDDAGAGRPAVVLLHGVGLDRSIWSPVAAALAARTRVINVDLRGSGESGRGEGPALMESLAGDVFGLLDALDVERAIVVGHSMGGYAALAFFRMYSERVAGLALVGSHTDADAPERAAERLATVEALGRGSMAPLVETLGPRLFAPEFAATQPKVVARIDALMVRADPAGTAAQLIGIKERVACDDLFDDIRVPMTIVAGERDGLLPFPSLERAALAIADCEFVRLAGVGHMPMLEAPQVLTAALERLVTRSSAAPHIAREARA